MCDHQYKYLVCCYTYNRTSYGRIKIGFKCIFVNEKPDYFSYQELVNTVCIKCEKVKYALLLGEIGVVNEM